MSTNGVNNSYAINAYATSNSASTSSAKESNSASIFHEGTSKDGKRDFLEGLTGGWTVRLVDDKINGRPALRLANPLHTVISSDISNKDKVKSVFNPLSSAVNACAFGGNEKLRNIADAIFNPIGSIVASFFKD